MLVLILHGSRDCWFNHLVFIVRLPCSIAVASSKAVLPPSARLTVSAPFGARAQGKPPVKIRYSEVVRSMLYAPAYVAITNGYFKDAGLDVSLTTAQGGDKAVAALLSNSADIALIGPESAIYVQNSELPTKTPIFCGLTATDGFMLMSREKIDKFEWSMLKGKEILGFRPGSTPILFFEAAHAAERHRPAQGRQAQQQRRDPGARRLLARGPEPVRHLHRAGRLAARTGRQGALPRLDRRDRRPGRLHHLHGDRQIHQRKSRGDPDLDRRDLQGAAVDRVAAAGGGGQGDRAVLPGRRSARPWSPRPSAIASSTSGRARRRSSRRPWRSSRTSWSRATCSRTPSA